MTIVIDVNSRETNQSELSLPYSVLFLVEKSFVNMIHLLDCLLAYVQGEKHRLCMISRVGKPVFKSVRVEYGQGLTHPS